MIEVPVTMKALDTARKRAAKYPSNMKNSFTKGAGILAGCVGEEIFHDTVGRNRVKPVHNYDYDYQVKDTGETIDVKTKTTSVKPEPHYECSVSGHNIRQVTDYYVFCRVTRDMTKGWVLGYLPKKRFFELAQHYKKGDKDPSNRFVFKSDTYSVRIDQLSDIADFGS